jgi:hypothetical protein
MNDDDLRRTLAATDLTAPGITLDEAVRRAASRTPSRRPSWTLRLAAAAIVTWVAVIALQATVERSMDAVVPVGPVLVAGEAVPSSLAQRRRLLAELMEDARWPPDAARPSPAEAGPPSLDATDHGRSGSLPARSWSHA